MNVNPDSTMKGNWSANLTCSRGRAPWRMHPYSVCIVLLVSLASNVNAQGPNDLLVAPPRAIFEGSTRSVTVSLINRGTDTSSYIISTHNYRMTEDGRLEEITVPDSGQLFADRIIRYFPRQVVLAPKEEQTLRIQLVAGRDLPDGEYRSHIYLRAIPRARAVETLDDTSAVVGVSMKLTPVYGIIVPVIVRHGDVTVAVEIPEMKLDTTTRSQPVLNVRLKRWGTASTYGDLAIDYHPPTGTPVAVGRINGVAVYPPSPSRTLHLPLKIPDGVSLNGGKLTVEYRSRSSYRENTLARGELVLP